MTTSDPDRDDDRTEAEVDLPTPGSSATVGLAPDADPTEAAAVAAAVGAYLRDERRAAAAAGASTGPNAAPIDRWTLAGRYGLRGGTDVPRNVRRGEEWKMAGRLRGRR